MKTAKKKLPQVQPEMCSTCPFRPGVPEKYSCLQEGIAESALNEASRICHQTGRNNAFHRRTGKPERLCRGARELQLNVFAAMGFIDAPTDEAWEKKCREMKL